METILNPSSLELVFKSLVCMKVYSITHKR